MHEVMDRGEESKPSWAALRFTSVVNRGAIHDGVMST